MQNLSEKNKIIVPNFKTLLQLAVMSEAGEFLCTSTSLYFIKRNLTQYFGQKLQEIINKFLTSKRFFFKSEINFICGTENTRHPGSLNYIK